METAYRPLAEILRPSSWQEVIGQAHLLGETGVLRRLIAQGFLPSMVLYGPSGVGKTSLARLLAKAVGAAHWVELSAVDTGVKELKAAVQKAEQYLQFHQQTVIFIDEIHRFNAAQQDALLQPVERGIVRLIGATTEDPRFSLNPALRSRLQVFALQPLSAADLRCILDRALAHLQRTLPESLADWLIQTAGQDARQLLGILEQLAQAFADWTHLQTSDLVVFFERSFAHSTASHYLLISAFIKTIRGGDADAAIYWLARMLVQGEDPLYIARRLVIAAAEDIGLANPNGLLLANQTLAAVQQIGMPEARIPLAQCTIYLAHSAKSQAAYRAINAAMDYVQKNPAHSVPLHLQPSAQPQPSLSFFPSAMQPVVFYES